MDLGIKGKFALITGGNRGIGLASAIEIAKEGCNVAITGRNEGDLASGVKKLEAFGVKGHFSFASFASSVFGLPFEFFVAGVA